MKPALPAARVEAEVRRRWGDVTDFHRLAEGLESQAFGFRRAGAEFVVRVNGSALGFEKDAYAQRTFGRAGLPIPEVVEIVHLNEGVALCLSRRAAGVRLHDLEPKAMERITDNLAQAIAGIAASDLDGTTGFGPFDQHGVAPFSSWRAFVLGVADPGLYDWASLGAKVERRLVVRALAAIREDSGSCPEVRCLVHGDLGSFNVLSDGSAVTAVIDWSLALFGDPLYEWAGLAFWREERLQPLRARFGPGDGGPRLRCYLLRIALEEMYQVAVGRNPGNLAHLGQRCAEMLQTRG